MCEHLALECAARIPNTSSARTRIVQHGGRTFLEFERFDRVGPFGRQVELLWWFGQLIASADMHLGNLSFRVAPASALTPADDMWPMLYAPQRGGEVLATAFDPPLPSFAQAEVWRAAATHAIGSSEGSGRLTRCTNSRYAASYSVSLQRSASVSVAAHAWRSVSGSTSIGGGAKIRQPRVAKPGVDPFVPHRHLQCVGQHGPCGLSNSIARGFS